MLAILVTVPFSRRPWALPILFRLYRNKKECAKKRQQYRKKTELFIQLERRNDILYRSPQLPLIGRGRSSAVSSGRNDARKSAASNASPAATVPGRTPPATRRSIASTTRGAVNA